MSTKISRFFIYVLIFLLPFNIRHIFNFYQIQNIHGFREHLAVSLYLVDLIFGVILALFFGDVIYHYFFKQTKQAPETKNLIDSKKPGTSVSCIWWSFFLLVAVLIISSLWSVDQAIALYNSVRILEVFIFFQLLKEKFVQPENQVNIAWIVFFSGIVQSVLAILQFVRQKSLGLGWLGESQLNAQMYDVAKIEIAGQKILRVYGTFPHPNLLGAFLLLALASGLWLVLNQSVDQTKETTGLSVIFNKFFSAKKVFIGIFMILCAIFLTFSRSIWLATFLLLLISFLNNKVLIFRRYLEKLVLAQSKRFFQISMVFIIVIGGYFCFPLINARLCLFNCENDQSYDLRKIYNQVAIKIIKDNSIIGIGSGNFVIMEKQLRPSLQPWENQPVHNLYLLIASELGIIGLVAVIIWFWLRLSKTKNYLIMSNPLVLLFYIFLILGLFDHYFYSLSQGQFLFMLGFWFFIFSGQPLLKNDC